MPEFTITVNKEKCAIFYCPRPAYSSGLCAKHYQNLVRYRDPVAPRNEDAHQAREMVAEFAAKVQALIDDTLMGSTCGYCNGMQFHGKHDPACPFGQVVEMLPRMADRPYGSPRKKAEKQEAQNVPV